jgi:lactate dehydrogenase-like 2-hydroxyacid dehydrogenase
MTVVTAERKGVPDAQVRPDRASFQDTLRRSTLIMITLPLTPSTQSLIAAPEFAIMGPETILINVARGGIVDEVALVDALRQKRIAGAATDVYATEPAGLENVLVREANAEDIRGRLILSPHLAWYARSSIEKLRRTVVENIESWVNDKPTNVVE